MTWRTVRFPNNEKTMEHSDHNISLCFRYIVAHYFARPLMYPGSVGLLQSAMSKSD